MYCSSNDFRCRDQGYCSCHQEQTAEAAGGCFGVLISIVAGVFAAFLYPAIRIFRSIIEYDDNDSPKFAGTKWLAASPVFGFLSQMLFQLTFTFGAAALISGPSRIAALVFKTGLFTIYSLAMGLAVIAFSIKNREAIKLFAVAPRTRTVRKLITIIGLSVIAVLAALAVTGIIFSAAEGYFIVRSGTQTKDIQDSRLVTDEKNKFDAYAGKYKLVTRKDQELFIVAKSDDGKNLRLNMDDGKPHGTDNPGCLLTPTLEGNAIYYTVSECQVDGKPSPLSQIYFQTANGRIKMNFIYNIRASGDTLEKIK